MIEALEEQSPGACDYVVAACCRSAPERASYMVPRDRLPASDEVLREARETDFEPDPVVAHHEAGHLVVGLLFGMTPNSVLVGTGGYVQWATRAPSIEAELTMIIAGDFAGGLFDRFEYRPFDAELQPYLDLIRQPAGGYCDRCRAVRALIVRHGLNASDATILGGYRAAEERTLEILRRLDVRAAIRAVAAALMKTGRLSGEEAVATAGAHIAPGELSETEKSE